MTKHDGNMDCGVFKRGYKIRKISPQNQHIQRKLLNFENWCRGELSKTGHHFSNKVIFKFKLVKNINKKCAPKLVFFSIKNLKDSDSSILF